MAVDTKFTSLFEKLKVEEPWLPPTTWESIPTQNTSRPSSFSSPPSPSISHTFSVSEASLVRLALNALQGVQSSLLSIEKLSAVFCSDPADRTCHRIPSLWNRTSSTHALGRILNSIGCLGSLVFLLRKFVDNFTDLTLDASPLENRHEECTSYSLVNQAFAVAVGKVLEGYICALDTLYASVSFRRLSADVDDVPACFTSVVHSEVTLLEVYLHTKELRTQIEALGNICNLHHVALCFSLSSFEDLTAKATTEFPNFYRGGDLLTYLYMQLQVADPVHHALLKFLFLRSCEPYCEFIRSWIFKAEISDPYKEFIVEYSDNLQCNLHCKAGFATDFPMASIRDGVAVPCFLKDFLIPVVRAGQQLKVLKKLLELCDYTGPGDYTYEDFLPSWSGYLSNHLLDASPITFGKGYLEAMLTARNNYYTKKQEKLENLLTMLKLRYQQVVLHGAVPMIFDSEGGSLKTCVSFMLGERFTIPPTADKWGSNVDVDDTDSDYSGTKSEFYEFDTHESSGCSSLSGSEGETEAEALIEHCNSFLGHEQRYLSSLRFSTSSHIDNTLHKPIQSEKSHDIENDIHENCKKTDALAHFVHSYDRKTTFNHIFMPLGLQESNVSSISEPQFTDSLTSNYGSLGLQLNSFYDDEGYNFSQRLDQCNSARDVSKKNMGFLKDGLLYFSRMTSTKDVLIGKATGGDQLENGTNTLNLPTLLPWNVNCLGNYLSTNPMLRQNACFHLVSNSGLTLSTNHGQSFPCFDFSAVEDPLKVSMEKLAASLSHELGPEVTSYTATSAAAAKRSKCYDKSKQGYGGDDVLIDNARAPTIHPPMDLEEHGQETVVPTDVCDGNSWESLLGSFRYGENASTGNHRKSLSSMFEIPLDFIIDKCLLQEILLQYKYVSKLAIKLLGDGFDLQEHFLALQRYYFMELADWADLFIMSLWHHKWSVADADHRVSEIQGFLGLSVQRSSCERDPNKDRLFVYIKANSIMPLSTSAIGVHAFDFLGLGYQVDWPVSIVLTPNALKIYAEIFSFLIQVKLAVFSLTDVWCSLKDLMHLISQNRHSKVHGKEVRHCNMLIKMRHQVNHFTSTLQQYVQSQLSHVSWCRFLHSLKYKVKDMMDLESVHMAYLTDSLHVCFLSDETRSVASIIESILQCALDFRSCLSGSMGGVRLDQGDLLGQLSRINITQVVAIKQKFDKNLKQLHLCYLKSPNHGESGLACFWGYLNYNEYYSDVGNQVDLYALQV